MIFIGFGCAVQIHTVTLDRRPLGRLPDRIMPAPVLPPPPLAAAAGFIGCWRAWSERVKCLPASGILDHALLCGLSTCVEQLVA